MKKVVRASFFSRDPLTCARELIGTELIWGECSGVVVEVEAYAAIDDEAAHTFTRPSARRFVERNKAGAAYVYFNYGVTLNDLGDRVGAINAFRTSIRIKPEFEPPYINLGRALEDTGQTGAAVAEWMKLINKLGGVTGDTVAHKLTAMHQAARVLEGMSSDTTAEEVLRQSLEIDRRQPEALQHFVSLRQRQCKWPAIVESDRVKRKDLLSGISTISSNPSARWYQ